jgi:hypothetical protein
VKKKQQRLLHQLNSALQVTAHSALQVIARSVQQVIARSVQQVAHAAVVVADVFNGAVNSASSVRIRV